MSLARIPIEPPARQRVPVCLIYAFVIGLAALGAWQFVAAVQKVRIAAAQSGNEGKLKQLSLALSNYHHANGHFPPAYILGPDGRPWHSWRVLILPYFELNELYREYRFDEPWDGPNNLKLAGRMPKCFASHGDDLTNLTTTNFLAVVGPETVWPGTGTRKECDITDGLKKTILLVENRGANVNWMEPRDLPFAEFDFALNRPNGLSSPYGAPAFVTVDGTITRLHKTITPETIRALLTAVGGETLDNSTGQWDVIPDGRVRERRE